MINNQVHDLINYVWRECDNDLHATLESLRTESWDFPEGDIKQAIEYLEGIV